METETLNAGFSRLSPASPSLPTPAGRRDRLRSMFWIAVLVIAPIGVGAVAAFGASSFSTPIYGAQAELILRPQQSGDMAEKYLNTQPVVATSHTVLQPVSTSLGIPTEAIEKNLSIDFPRGSTVMQFQYSDADQSVAVKALGAILDQYLSILAQVELVDGSTHQLLAPPFLLDRPVRPRPMQAAAIGGAIGLAIGLGAFALIQIFRSSR